MKGYGITECLWNHASMVYFSELLQRAVYRITYYDKTRYCGVREYAIVYQTDLIYLLIYIYIVVNDLVLSLRYTVVKPDYLNFQQDEYVHVSIESYLIFFSRGKRNETISFLK